jgi:hypothetical protein
MFTDVGWRERVNWLDAPRRSAGQVRFYHIKMQFSASFAFIFGFVSIKPAAYTER